MVLTESILIGKCHTFCSFRATIYRTVPIGKTNKHSLIKFHMFSSVNSVLFFFFLVGGSKNTKHLYENQTANRNWFTILFLKTTTTWLQVNNAPSHQTLTWCTSMIEHSIRHSENSNGNVENESKEWIKTLSHDGEWKCNCVIRSLKSTWCIWLTWILNELIFDFAFGWSLTLFVIRG